MNKRTPRAEMTTRVIRPGDSSPPDDYVLSLSFTERITLVWELTKLCYQWSPNAQDALRFQRSVTRIFRPPS